MEVAEPPAEETSTGRRTLKLVVLAVLAAGVIGLAVLLLTPRDVADDPVVRGGSVAAVVFEEFDGEGTVALASFAGRPLVVNFWASWCVPCIEEMPDLQSVYEEVGDRVAFLGVNVMDAEELSRRMVEQTGVRYPLARDREGDRFRALDGIGMPTTLFVDEAGRIVERFTGPLDAEELRERIRRQFGV